MQRVMSENSAAREDFSMVITSIDVCVHATGHYLDYARALAGTLEEFLFPGAHIRMLVFTDRPAEVREWPRHTRVSVIPVETEGRPWPEATLLRFKDYSLQREQLTSDLVLFLDADMELRNVVGPELNPAEWVGGVALVRHPGFFEPPHMPKRSIFRRAKRLASSRGSWETREESLAFVPKDRRLVYVCGGVWLGYKDRVLDVCTKLAQRIDEDASRGVVAVWHDESHLNWWAAHHECELLVPEYCYSPGYPALSEFTPRIVALDKPAEFVNRVKG